jgi:hypothetical protein
VRAVGGFHRSACPFCVALGRCFAPGLLTSGYHTPVYCMALRPSPFWGLPPVLGTVLLTSVGRLSMTARTYATSLSLSIATCSTCDAVWFDADAFPPLLPTFDCQSLAAGQRSPPSTWEPGVEFSPVWVYHLTWMDAQLSRFLATGRPWLSSVA